MSEPLRVLLIEDNPGDARLLQEHLRDAEASDVVIVCDGTLGEGMRRLREENVDLVLLDLSLPDAKGLQTFHTLHDAHPDVPVVVLTGLEDDGVALSAVRDGAQDFLVKGQVNGHRLVQAMRYAVERQRLLEKTLISKQARDRNDGMVRTQVVDDPDRLEHYSVAGYRINRVLGEGSMATVYLAQRENDPANRDFALKIMKLDKISNKNRQALLERFFREAEVAASVKHENIVEIVEFGMAPDRQAPYIVMEHVSGNTLQHFLGNEAANGFDYREKAYILRQVAAALAAIHDKNICHRDIKPGNIIVDSKLHVKITDFGIALVPGSELTIDLHLIGSPAYMSPEAFRSPKIDSAADIFSFGIVAYEFLVGCRPFDGQTIAQLAQQIQFERPPEPRKLSSDFPMRLQQILAKALKKGPAQRYASCHQLAHELDSFINETVSPPALLLGAFRQRLLRGDWR